MAEAEVSVVQSRNIGIVRVRVADLVDSPWNYRGHPDEQFDALGGTEDQIGWFGHPDVFTNAEGRYQLIDGALRKAYLLRRYGDDVEIDVNATDFTEEEARTALLAKDAVSAMATADRERLRALRADVAARAPGMRVLLEDVAKRHRLDLEKRKREGDDGSQVARSVMVEFTGDQWTTVSRAVVAVRTGEGDATIPPGRALELIAADYLAGAQQEPAEG